MPDIDLLNYQIIINTDLKGKSNLRVEPAGRINLETVANILSMHLRLVEREIVINQMLKLLQSAVSTNLQMNKLPSLEEIKKSKQ